MTEDANIRSVDNKDRESAPGPIGDRPHSGGEIAQQSALAQLDSSMLTDWVRRAVESPTATVDTWTTERVSGSLASTTEGVFRLSGTGLDQHQTGTWSLIVKIIRARTDQLDVTSPTYWKREALVFQAGLLDDLPNGLVAPHCYGIIERPDEMIGA